jgi:hypothetical protein
MKVPVFRGFNFADMKTFGMFKLMRICRQEGSKIIEIPLQALQAEVTNTPLRCISVLILDFIGITDLY